MKWKSHHIDFVRSNYGVIPTKQIAANLGCTVMAVQSRAKLLGIMTPV